MFMCTPGTHVVVAAAAAAASAAAVLQALTEFFGSLSADWAPVHVHT
jgi:hypothetical protein